MSEPVSYSKEWLETHAREPARSMHHADTEENLDEFEGVVEALSMLDTFSRDDIRSQSRISNTKLRPFSMREKPMTATASDAGSSVSSSSSAWDSTHSNRRWHKSHGNREFLERVQHKAGTSGSIHKGQEAGSTFGEDTGSIPEKQDGERMGEGAILSNYEAKYGKLSADESLRQRIGDLEQKVNMLIADEYFHRVTVPQGCFVLVLPGPGCAQKFTEDLIESLQARIESVWPLCYFSPVVAKLASLATAILSWLPLPAPVYSWKFSPELDYATPTYEIRKLAIST